jgi:chromosome segregation ATPase
MDTLPVPSLPSRNIEMEKWTDTTNKTFVLESAPDLFQSDSDDDYLYEEIPIEEFEDDKSDTEDENLEETVRNITERRFFEENEAEIKNIEENKDNVASTTKQPEVVEDYIRNFFYSRGLKKSLETFQEEWYEFKKKGHLSPEDSETVPDVYVKNQKLADNIQKLRINIEEYKDIANKAQSTFEKLKKERDYHRMHHQRVVQEKNKLISDIHRLKNKCSMFEPMIEGIQKKYENAMKEKMLTKLDRDRLAGKIVTLESTISQLENLIKDKDAKNNGRITQNNANIKNGIFNDTTTTTTTTTITNNNNKVHTSKNNQNHSSFSSADTKNIHPKHSLSGRESVLPLENRQNPFSNLEISPAKTSPMKILHNIKAHDAAISW